MLLMLMTVSEDVLTVVCLSCVLVTQCECVRVWGKRFLLLEYCGLSFLSSSHQDNIGHRLLQKHGWKLGQGLGKTMQGKQSRFTVKLNLSHSFCLLISTQQHQCPMVWSVVKMFSFSLSLYSVPAHPFVFIICTDNNGCLWGINLFGP